VETRDALVNFFRLGCVWGENFLEFFVSPFRMKIRILDAQAINLPDLEFFSNSLRIKIRIASGRMKIESCMRKKKHFLEFFLIWLRMKIRISCASKKNHRRPNS
jgi:hypothetical protein